MARVSDECCNLRKEKYFKYRKNGTRQRRAPSGGIIPKKLLIFLKMNISNNLVYYFANLGPVVIVDNNLSVVRLLDSNER